MSKPTTSTALEHLRVLDLTRVRAGPTCCRVFADFGADVIKIEAPEGADPNSSTAGLRHGYDFLNLHRNKRSLTLNLKKPEGHAIFMSLVETHGITTIFAVPTQLVRLLDHPSFDPERLRFFDAAGQVRRRQLTVTR